MTEITKDEALESFNKQIEIQQTLDKKLLEKIQEFGYTYMGVFGDATLDKPAFIYTVGLHLHGLPEIIMSGNLDPNEMHGVISNLASYWLQEKRAIFGDYPKFIVMAEGQEASITVIKVDTNYANENYIKAVARIYPQAQYEVAQLFWPDKEGKLPFEDEYTKDKTYLQEILPQKEETKCLQLS
jgi:hypothetical protein